MHARASSGHARQAGLIADRLEELGRVVERPELGQGMDIAKATAKRFRNANEWTTSVRPRTDTADAVDRDVRDVSWRRVGHGWKHHVRAEVDVREPLQ